MNNIIQPPSCCQEQILKFRKPHCLAYCKLIVSGKNSPWKANGSPLRFYIQQGQNKFSKLQMMIINHLHKYYFSRGRPYCATNKFLAKKINHKNVDGIKKSITELCERNILYRIIIVNPNKSLSRIIIPNNQFLNISRESSYEK